VNFYSLPVLMRKLPASTESSVRRLPYYTVPSAARQIHGLADFVVRPGVQTLSPFRSASVMFLPTPTLAGPGSPCHPYARLSCLLRGFGRRRQ
jgi:hypothetical protein